MGILLAFGRGTVVMAIILFAFALLKRLVIVFGFFLGLIKLAILIAFLALFIAIAVAMIRGWCDSKDTAKSA